MIMGGIVPRYLVVGEDVLIYRSVGSELFGLFNNWQLRHNDRSFGSEELTRRNRQLVVHT